MNMREKIDLAIRETQIRRCEDTEDGAAVYVMREPKVAEVVDAILDAMREPSVDVREAGSLRIHGVGQWTIDITPGFQAMIDAIKAGK